MSAEAILEYPALFSGPDIVDMDKLIEEYIEFYKKYPGEGNLKIMKAHMFKFMHAGFTNQGHTDLRTRLNNAGYKPEDLPEYEAIAAEMKERRAQVGVREKLGWYSRHLK